jgi:Recombination endonuclease VII
MSNQDTPRKVCTSCWQEKPVTQFRVRQGKYSPGRPRTECLECEALYNRLSGRCHKRERLTKEEFHRMYEGQQGLCACCGIALLIRECEIDHNHSTGKIRGLVCCICNKAIGYIETGRTPNVERHIDVGRYLEKYD